MRLICGTAIQHVCSLDALCHPVIAICQRRKCTNASQQALRDHSPGRCRQAIDWVENTVKEEGIECKFERVDGYLFPYIEQDSDYNKLEQEIGSAHKVDSLPLLVMAC